MAQASAQSQLASTGSGLQSAAARLNENEAVKVGILAMA
jgi:hypothetical protein